MPALAEEEELAAAPAAPPPAFIEYRGDMPPLQIPPVATLEERLARVPRDLQEILIGRGRSLERLEQARIAYHQARAGLEEASHRERLEMVRERLLASVDWSACCAPQRADIRFGVDRGVPFLPIDGF